MRKYAFLLMAVILSSGCHRIFDNTGSSDNTSNLVGVWNGSITLNGKTQNIYLNLAQTNKTITPESYMSIDYGMTLECGLTGNVSGNNFFTRSPVVNACPNTWTAAGQVSGNNMVVTIDGLGNQLPYCYPDPIHEQIVLVRK